ncbi:alpha/beta hydrolase [Streptomyces sp. NPDC090493]|uniref:alpha/beta hydrolase n=1 Tax=Streptomyces sp. NPDC090493 TaxID=3365964 RepID=UPI00381DE1AE
MAQSPTVVFVHGAFADASGFGGVARELDAAGYNVVAVPNPLRGLAFDSAAATEIVRAIDGPVLLVGHSYGGAVISHVASAVDNVVGLVYLAAFGLEVGESCVGVQEPFPPALLSTTSSPTAYDAPGASDGPDLYISREGFRETFCADVPVDVAEVMFATQRPIALSALTGEATAAGWKDKPSWYLLCEDDKAIVADAQSFMAKRMGATVLSMAGSHTAFIAQPVTVARFILQALTAVV